MLYVCTSTGAPQQVEAAIERGADVTPTANNDQPFLGTWFDVIMSESNAMGTIYTFKTNMSFDQTKVFKVSSANLIIDIFIIYGGNYHIQDDILTLDYFMKYISTDGGKTFKWEVFTSTSKWRYTFGADDIGEYVAWTNISDDNSGGDSEIPTGEHKYYKQR